jgi:hypothetical protein
VSDKNKKFKFLIPILSGLLAVIFVLSGAIYIFFNINLFSEEKIQIIKASKGPVKEKPLDSGGKIIDHLDADFYGILDKDIDTKVVEVIKPPSPEPELPSVQLDLENLEVLDNISINTDINNVFEPDPLTSNDNISTSSKENILNDNLSQVNDNNSLTNNLILNDNITQIIDSPISKPKKGYFIQLASFNNKNKAKLSVDILNEKLAVTLAGNSLKIMKVDLGQGKGVWWRIVTDILSRSESETICALLKSEGNNCIVRSK